MWIVSALPLIVVLLAWAVPNGMWPAWLGVIRFFLTIPDILIGPRLARAFEVACAAAPLLADMSVKLSTRSVVVGVVVGRGGKGKTRRRAEDREKRRNSKIKETTTLVGRRNGIVVCCCCSSRCLVLALSLICCLMLSAVVFPAIWFPPNQDAFEALEVALKAHSVPPLPDGSETLDFAYHIRQLGMHACRRRQLPDMLCSKHPSVAVESFHIPVDHSDGSGTTHQLVDVFAPVGARNSSHVHDRPVLVFFHGGGWISGSTRYQGLPLILELASRGWVCVSVGYRLISPLRYVLPRLFVLWMAALGVSWFLIKDWFKIIFAAGLALLFLAFARHFGTQDELSLLHALEDVYRGIEWTHENAAAWRGLTAGPRGYLAGYGVSAGAHMLLMAAMEGPLALSNDTASESVFDAVLPCYAPTDFHDGEWHAPHFLVHEIIEEVLLKETKAWDTWSRYAPLHRMTTLSRNLASSKFFMVHGADDSLVPLSHSQLMMTAFHTHNVTASLTAVPNAQHAFDVFPTSFAGVEVTNALVRFLEHDLSQKRGSQPS